MGKAKDSKEAVDNIEIEDIVAELVEDEALEAASANELIEQIEVLQKRLDQSEESEQESKDQYLRAHAEMENIRRRSERDVTNARKFALERFAQDLLPVVDSMEKATEVESDNPEVTSMREGVEMTMKMFVDTVSKFGLKQIDPMGEKFDPNSHEAMVMQPNPDVEPNTVIAVFQKGYELNGRVIRPARVVVSQG
jgi:molecular chaperone GrpE